MVNLTLLSTLLCQSSSIVTFVNLTFLSFIINVTWIPNLNSTACQEWIRSKWTFLTKWIVNKDNNNKNLIEVIICLNILLSLIGRWANISKEISKERHLLSSRALDIKCCWQHGDSSIIDVFHHVTMMDVML